MYKQMKQGENKSREKWCKYNGSHKTPATPKATHRPAPSGGAIKGHHRKNG